MAYLYNYIGKPEKTTEKVHYILNNFYKNTPDGLIGNEDCGQMSAWYVLSSMGIYSVTPGKAEWNETKPLYSDIKIKIGDSNDLANIKEIDKGLEFIKQCTNFQQ
jgi:putative alpha-1,2-mannosidase